MCDEVQTQNLMIQEYELLELQVASNFHPDNSFCFTIDSSADGVFKTRLQNLSACIDNVFVAGEFDALILNLNKDIHFLYIAGKFLRYISALLVAVSMTSPE